MNKEITEHIYKFLLGNERSIVLINLKRESDVKSFAKLESFLLELSKYIKITNINYWIDHINRCINGNEGNSVFYLELKKKQNEEEIVVTYNSIKTYGERLNEIKGENISLLGINESDFYEIKKGPKRKLII